MFTALMDARYYPIYHTTKLMSCRSVCSHWICSSFALILAILIPVILILKSLMIQNTREYETYSFIL